ncbi:rod-binding protein [Devosia sp. XJ19-1]|uniref:Rod-binding protein n=1 Tax=Devosia ureilytica TaxID=2952754 RepID=A0A9Q4ANX9_9HYPH|nr:rod-binding protein [Devosia ureilytica]MCP8883522.1 rod-binding protein [Devosia ureilytica]MCP8887130.1 rod-binding protein [Devosia ureilytica]
MNAIDQTGSSLSPDQLLRIRTQAQDLEGVFLNMLTKEMFASIKSDENFGGGFGEETWRSMQAEQLANTMAQSGGVGIADDLMGQMIALQEAANASRGLTNSNIIASTGVYGK